MDGTLFVSDGILVLDAAFSSFDTLRYPDVYEVTIISGGPEQLTYSERG
jgi:hypothetical protein